jgi:hypothetical protein
MYLEKPEWLKFGMVGVILANFLHWLWYTLLGIQLDILTATWSVLWYKICVTFPSSLFNILNTLHATWNTTCQINCYMICTDTNLCNFSYLLIFFFDHATLYLESKLKLWPEPHFKIAIQLEQLFNQDWNGVNWFVHI